ncbi:MAG: hypothetical protein WKF67_13885 [Rubrobacteraceae bacterium]
MGLGTRLRIGWPGWLRTDLAGWWLTGLGLVPLFVVSGTLVLGGLGVATGVTDADAAWIEVPLAILFGVYATPVFGILAAVYLLALRLSLRNGRGERLRRRALALSPILISPWLVLTVVGPGEWAEDGIAAAPVLLGVRSGTRVSSPCQKRLQRPARGLFSERRWVRWRSSQLSIYPSGSWRLSSHDLAQGGRRPVRARRRDHEAFSPDQLT